MIEVFRDEFDDVEWIACEDKAECSNCFEKAKKLSTDLNGQSVTLIECESCGDKVLIDDLTGEEITIVDE